MRAVRRAAAVALLLAACPSLAAQAAEAVDVALVLVSDVSRSIDDGEYEIEKKGYAQALASREVVAAIAGGAIGAIAVAYVEFASVGEVATVIDWTVVRDAASAADLAARVQAAPRSFSGRTAIGAGIDAGARLLAHAPFETSRRVIDVCGDGTNNAGRDVAAARDEAVGAGIVVNGLAIINDHPAAWTYAHVQPPGGLGAYYRENVAGGPGSFVLEVHEFHAIAEGMIRKLVSEIAAIRPEQRSTHAAR